jgi:ectoine hydroxylase-related dioxygenase (phytanoyl-CoA dioxygenase family)
MGMISVEDFKICMDKVGFVIFERFIDAKMIDALLGDFHNAYEACREIQIKNGVKNSQGTCHHLVGQGDSFMEYLSNFEKLDEYVQSYFGGKYILNSFGGNILHRGESYANNIHRDQRSYSGGEETAHYSFLGSLALMMNTIVTLDDFTSSNGATWLMVSGHRFGKKPEDDQFRNAAIQAVAPAGSVIMFNSNMWHRAGENRTDNPRRSITPMFSKPFIKPGFDYTQYVNDDSPEYLKQILGYNSRTPSTLSEWYQPKEKRFYKADQE